ncbi:hypothetical protein TNCV_1889221 [Trichonephila clavipes]|nr:hypothetical protein TNCV_1889221 [Trichonephila clavipes]
MVDYPFHDPFLLTLSNCHIAPPERWWPICLFHQLASLRPTIQVSKSSNCSYCRWLRFRGIFCPNTVHPSRQISMNNHDFKFSQLRISNAHRVCRRFELGTL